MRFQSEPKIEFSNYFKLITNSKHLATRKLLQDSTKDVTNRCEEYIKSLAKMQSLAKITWEPKTKSALESCYTVKTIPLSDLKDEMLKSLKEQSEINLQRCAYCMMGEPLTWDHYLPKEHFPEFSVFHANLVYVCFSCNNKKRSGFSSKRLIYCHPYFTVHRETPLLHCSVRIENDKPSVSFYCETTTENNAAEIAQNHIDNLNLSKKFNCEASSLINGIIGDIRAISPDGISEKSLNRVLANRYAEAQQRAGCNAWDARLWHGLGHCKDFLEYVNKQIKKTTAQNIMGFDIPPPIQR